MSYSASSHNNNGRFDLFSATTNAIKRIEAASNPTFKGTARGRMLELVGQVRPVFVPKKEEIKPAEKPLETATNSDGKDKKPADKKDEKPVEQKNEKKDK